MKHFKEIKNTLVAEFTFKNFIDALEFVNQVGNIAEIHNHHPDISLHDYKFVSISTTTHDAGNSITIKDTTIAEVIEKSYKK